MSDASDGIGKCSSPSLTLSVGRPKHWLASALPPPLCVPTVLRWLRWLQTHTTASFCAGCALVLLGLWTLTVDMNFAVSDVAMGGMRLLYAAAARYDGKISMWELHSAQAVAGEHGALQAIANLRGRLLGVTSLGLATSVMQTGAVALTAHALMRFHSSAVAPEVSTLQALIVSLCCVATVLDIACSVALAHETPWRLQHQLAFEMAQGGHAQAPRHPPQYVMKTPPTKCGNYEVLECCEESSDAWGAAERFGGKADEHP